MNDLSVEEIIQISPEFKTKCFAGCLATVVEVKSFGCMCYIQGVGETFEDVGHQYYLRLSHEDFEITGGISPWVISNE